MSLLAKILVESGYRCDACGRRFTTRVPAVVYVSGPKPGTRRGVDDSIVLCKEAADELIGLSGRALFLRLSPAKGNFDCPKPRRYVPQPAVRKVKKKTTRTQPEPAKNLDAISRATELRLRTTRASRDDLPMSWIDRAPEPVAKVEEIDANRIREALLKRSLSRSNLLTLLDRARSLNLPEDLIDQLKREYDIATSGAITAYSVDDEGVVTIRAVK